MKIKKQKNGNYATLVKFCHGGYVVRLYKCGGELLDKMRCDTYRGACEYFKSFNLIAKNGA